jgi:L-asparaginase
MNARPRVGLITSGGTIESLGLDRLDLAWYIEAKRRLNFGELVDLVPEVESIAQIKEVAFRRVASHELTTQDLAELVATIHRLADDDGVDGIVITHGTNTLEETAFFLHLTVKRSVPVVVVGAMRPANALGADGTINLVNATRVAVSSASKGLGVLVVLNDTIHTARDVTKATTTRVDAFRDRELGPLGYVGADGRVAIYRTSLRRHTTESEFDTPVRALPRVDIVLSHLGADGTMIRAASEVGARGIVVAGTGAGRVSKDEERALRQAVAKGVVVCMSSRVGSGLVFRSPTMASKGYVAADNISPWKARILLALALTRTSEPSELQRIFDTY